MSDGRTIALVEKRSTVLERDYGDSEVELTVRIGLRQVNELLAKGAVFRINGLDPHEALRREWKIERPQRRTSDPAA